MLVEDRIHTYIHNIPTKHGRKDRHYYRDEDEDEDEAEETNTLFVRPILST